MRKILGIGTPGQTASKCVLVRKNILARKKNGAINCQFVDSELLQISTIPSRSRDRRILYSVGFHSIAALIQDLGSSFVSHFSLA